MRFEYIIFIVLIVILSSHLFLNKTLNYNLRGKVAKLSQELGDFPRPQPSIGYKQLSKQIVLDPLYKKPIEKVDESKVNIIRSSNLDNDRNPIYYKPDAYKKDFISPNPLGTTEYNFAEFNDDKTSYAWTDNNVSQHPLFYRSEFKDEKTNVGKFFDKANKFHDKTSSYSTNNLPDRCFLDKEDNIICNFNDRLQNIPPSLITNKKTSVIDNIGVCGVKDNLYKEINSEKINNIDGKSYVTFQYNNEKEMNGAEVFKGVQGSNSSNQSYLELDSLDYKNNFAF